MGPTVCAPTRWPLWARKRRRRKRAWPATHATTPLIPLIREKARRGILRRQEVTPFTMEPPYELEYVLRPKKEGGKPTVRIGQADTVVDLLSRVRATGMRKVPKEKKAKTKTKPQSKKKAAAKAPRKPASAAKKTPKE